MGFYGYNECNDEQGDLVSFEIILADQNKENRVKLAKSGPTDQNIPNQVCSGHTFPWSYVYRAAIYADENRVYGIKLQAEESAVNIGSEKGVPVLQVFSETSQLIGFYGSQNGSQITSLGFITHDPKCSGKIAEEFSTVTASVGTNGVASSTTTISNTDDDDNDTLKLFIYIALGIFVAILIVVGVCYCIKQASMNGTPAPVP